MNSAPEHEKPFGFHYTDRLKLIPPPVTGGIPLEQHRLHIDIIKKLLEDNNFTKEDNNNLVAQIGQHIESMKSRANLLKYTKKLGQISQMDNLTDAQKTELAKFDLDNLALELENLKTYMDENRRRGGGSRRRPTKHSKKSKKSKKSRKSRKCRRH
jgi:hypothetical protein